MATTETAGRKVPFRFKVNLNNNRFMDYPIQSLDCGPRGVRILLQMGMTTVGDLVKEISSESSILMLVKEFEREVNAGITSGRKINLGCGPNTAHEIMKAILELYTSFMTDEEVTMYINSCKNL